MKINLNIALIIISVRHIFITEFEKLLLMKSVSNSKYFEFNINKIFSKIISEAKYLKDCSSNAYYWNLFK